MLAAGSIELTLRTNDQLEGCRVTHIDVGEADVALQRARQLLCSCATQGRDEVADIAVEGGGDQLAGDRRLGDRAADAAFGEAFAFGVQP